MKLDVGAVEHGAPVALDRRLGALRAEIAVVAQSAGRDPSSITLVGITKGQPRSAVSAAVAAGLRDVGENYVQEARMKYAGLSGARKHFVGHVQTNKAKAIVETFDVVQTIDRLEAGVAVLRASRALGRNVTALLQIKIAGDKEFGCPPAQASALASRLRGEGLTVDGVMAIGPITDDPAATQRAFETAARAFERVGGSTLSLGMSGDWRQALAAGSTMLRIGTALFGARE